MHNSPVLDLIIPLIVVLAVALLLLRFNLSQLFRVYSVVKTATIATLKIVFGLLICGAAAMVFRIASHFITWTDSPNISVFVLGIVLTIAGYGLMTIFEALPGIIPARIANEPGRSRLAERDEMRHTL
jgi:hypothetical protein